MDIAVWITISEMNDFESFLKDMKKTKHACNASFKSRLCLEVTAKKESNCSEDGSSLTSSAFSSEASTGRAPKQRK